MANETKEEKIYDESILGADYTHGTVNDKITDHSGRFRNFQEKAFKARAFALVFLLFSHKATI